MTEKIDIRITPGICPLSFIEKDGDEEWYCCHELTAGDPYPCVADIDGEFEMSEYKDKCWFFSKWFWNKVTEK